MTEPCSCRVAWFNGKFMPENQVLISFRDRSWKYGDGAFDMTRTFNGRAFRLKEHIDRFYRTLRYLRLDPGMSPQEMIDLGYALVGNVDTVCRRLEATLERLPAEWIFFWAFNGLVPHAAMLRTIERWQTQVLPKLGLA